MYIWRLFRMIMSFKMNKLLSAGNTYQVVVKSIDKNSFKILIRELTRENDLPINHHLPQRQAMFRFPEADPAKDLI